MHEIRARNRSTTVTIAEASILCAVNLQGNLPGVLKTGLTEILSQVKSGTLQAIVQNLICLKRLRVGMREAKNSTLGEERHNVLSQCVWCTKCPNLM